MTDEAFFAEHKDRTYRIRVPEPGEFADEFRSLGPHEKDRRRVIVKRVEWSKARMFGVKLMPIPMLAFADETIEDDDATLSPVFDGIMKEAMGGLL